MPIGIVAVFSVLIMVSLVGVEGFEAPFDKLVFRVIIGSTDSSDFGVVFSLVLHLSVFEGRPGLILVGVLTVFVPYDTSPFLTFRFFPRFTFLPFFLKHRV